MIYACDKRKKMIFQPWLTMVYMGLERVKEIARNCFKLVTIEVAELFSIFIMNSICTLVNFEYCHPCV